MKVKDYCKNMEMELTAWKAKLYDVTNKIDALPTKQKERMYENINALRIVMMELDDRLEALRIECPTEFGPEREEIKSRLDDLVARYDETADLL